MNGWHMPPGVFGMTPCQRDCLRVICELTDATGRSPSYAEIAAELDCGPKTDAARMVVGLIERGWLARRRRHRGLQILHRPPMPDFTTPGLPAAGG